jgi:hypothetical protein
MHNNLLCTSVKINMIFLDDCNFCFICYAVYWNMQRVHDQRVLCLVCSMSLVFLDFSFMIAPSDFSNDYLFFSQWFVFVFIYAYACVCVLKENRYLNVISERKYTTGITCWAGTGYTSCAPALPSIWTLATLSTQDTRRRQSNDRTIC